MQSPSSDLRMEGMEGSKLLEPGQDNSPLHSPSSDLQRSELKKWIKDNNICKMECCNFEKVDGRGEICKCGYQKTQHAAEDIKGVDAVDSRNRPRQKVPTDAFGEISFGGSGQKISKYMRVSTDTSPEVLYRLLTEKWKLSPPKLLISVTGGAKNFSLKSRLGYKFYSGITELAELTGAWILTGGTNTGVMKHVGQAVGADALISSTGSQIVAIGIATWGVIHNRQDLVDAEGSFPAPYVIDTKGQGQLTCLDNNHTHFLLVDDGTHGKYDVEFELRSHLEEYISWKCFVNKESSVVSVVLDGGPGTLDAISKLMLNGTPCVIIEGSGGIADVIAEVSGMPVARVTIDLIHQLLKKFFGQEYESFSDLQIIEWTKKIQDIIRETHLLTVFRMSEYDLEVVILQALQKAARSREFSVLEIYEWKLELAIRRKQVDMGREILTEESHWKSSDLHCAMFSALVGNLPEFVSLLLETGVNLKDFLQDEKTLCALYEQMPSCSFVDNISCQRKEDQKKKKSNSLKFVCEEVQRLLGGFTGPLYPETNSKKSDASIKISEDMTMSLWSKDEPDSNGPNRESNDEAHRDPGRDLFLWAIVQNNKEIAEIAWKKCRDCVTAALGASKILKTMAEEEGDADKAESMQELANYYEKCAIGVFSKLHNRDKERAQNLLVRVSPLWGGKTSLKLALEADNKNFIAQSGVQALLTQIWCGELSVKNPVWKVLLCMLLFPLIYTDFLKFRRNDLIQARNEEMKTKETENKSRTNSLNTVEPLKPLDSRPKLRCLYTSPQVKFYWNIVFYFAFLFLFAVVLMMDFQTSPSAGELLLYFWVFTLVCEEIRQLFHDPDDFGLDKKTKIYFNEMWNILDVLSIILFIIGLAFRLTPWLFYVGKVILCIDFVVFCLRLMAIFTIGKTLGPKIIIVRRMIKDMFFFMFLLSIWVVAYGVAKQGILIDNDVRLDWIIRGVVYESYLIIFGDIPSNIDYAKFEMDACSINGTDPHKPKCPILDENDQPAFPQWLTIILLCVYLVFANILLLNLLIAIFNFTFQEVQDNTDKIWKFQRYELIKEYYSRPAAPPPLIIFNHLDLLIRRAVSGKPPMAYKEFRKKLSPIEEEELLSWEVLMRGRYLHSEQKEQSQSMERRILDTANMVSTMNDRLERNEESNSVSVMKRLDRLEEHSTKALQWIMDSLKSQGFAPKETQTPVTANETAQPLSDSSEKDESSHVKCRQFHYPDSRITRFPVPEEKVSWEVNFNIYTPPYYNSEDGDQVDRPESGAILDKYRNPGGRTGIRGQGSLPELGPNQNMEVVITRWQDNDFSWQDSDRTVLEYLAVWDDRRRMFSLPSGPVNSADKLPETVMKLFELINTLLPEGTKVFECYVDDPRNTDNAWMENTVLNIDLTTTRHLADIDSMVKESNDALQWQEVCSKTSLSSNQRESLRLVAASHNVKF